MQQPDPVRRGGGAGRLSRPLPRNLQIPGSPVRMRPLQYVLLRVLTRSSSLPQLIAMRGGDVPPPLKISGICPPAQANG